MPNGKYKPYKLKVELAARTEKDLNAAIERLFKELKSTGSSGYSGWYDRDKDNEVDVRWDIYNGLDL
jgi:hypothetical protein